MHNGEVNKAEHDKMLNEIAHIQEDLKNIYENVNAMKEIIGRHEVDIRVLKICQYNIMSIITIVLG